MRIISRECDGTDGGWFELWGRERCKYSNIWLDDKCQILVADMGGVYGWKFSMFLIEYTTGSDWCNLDTGKTTITDGRGVPHNVYISATRDGSIWLRAGMDHESADWTYQSETRYKIKVTILGNDVTSMLQSLDYLDYCVLSDIDLVVNTDGGWHPSYIVLYDPVRKQNNVAAFKKKEGACNVQTNVTLGGNKQWFYCNGAQHNVCGLRHLPEKGHSTATVFINNLQLDPWGPDHWYCEGKEMDNFYTFKGSYYHAYVKLASCPIPADSRMFGHSATLRAHIDDKLMNTVIIPDPTQTALRDGVIRSWQVFAKEVSIEHTVYLQVWRPTLNHEDAFSLVAQTLYKPKELRFQEVRLPRKEYIDVRSGDVLGLYFPKHNPLAWSSVPCAYETQQYKFLINPRRVSVGQTLYFNTVSSGVNACRHYSFAASFANKTHAKVLEDWICPTARPPTGARRRSETARDVNLNDNNIINDNKNNKQAKGNPTTKKEDRNLLTEGTIPLHLILIIIACLFVLLMGVGFVSYYRAMHS
ncbi:hypothetical protein LSH36_489g02017 [Paralvinella palmiformis]|uniref:Uncharacterized protein n=1 Tax=Paralvinella palmiformis TaxID=53620 RepID=A0AAD9MZD5_9ANNE|nr:hypothetical protein LSH36_489g02017 [Paralvinella palmiformis]